MWVTVNNFGRKNTLLIRIINMILVNNKKKYVRNKSKKM